VSDRDTVSHRAAFQTVLVSVIIILGAIYLSIQSNQGISFLDLLKTIFYALLLRFGDIPANVKLLFLDVVLFLGGLFLWLGIFSQFVVPLRKASDRYWAFDRLIVYLAGQSGLTVSIENGVVRQRPHEMQRRGPGLIILDTASAAVLRKAEKFSRIVGPGVIFTKKDEYIARAVDLHRQAYPRPSLGPSEEEDPFLPRQKNEKDEEYQNRRLRRLQTSGMTRDGVEVVPNIMVVFHLDRFPEDTRLWFGYNPESVQKWVTAAGINQTDEFIGLTRGVPLQQLPAYLAVDVWREYLQKFLLNELFISRPDKSSRGETALDTILHMVHARLTQSQVDDLDDEGKPTERNLASQEFEILQKRGIRVDAVVINNLRLTRAVETKLVQDWTATWLQKAQAEHKKIEAERSEILLLGKEEGLKRFALSSIRYFSWSLINQPRTSIKKDLFLQMKIALDILIRGTLSECVSDPVLKQHLFDEISNLSELINWIRVQEE
jgi:hypothetical protein